MFVPDSGGLWFSHCLLSGHLVNIAFWKAAEVFSVIHSSIIPQYNNKWFQGINVHLNPPDIKQRMCIFYQVNWVLCKMWCNCQFVFSTCHLQFNSDCWTRCPKMRWKSEGGSQTWPEKPLSCVSTRRHYQGDITLCKILKQMSARLVVYASVTLVWKVML